MTKTLLNQNSGFAMIESLVGTAALCATIMGLFLAAYLCLAKVWLSHTSYEALMCAAGHVEMTTCENRFRKTFHQVLHFGRIERFRFIKTTPKLQLLVRFSLARIHFDEDLAVHLPLSERLLGASPKTLGSYVQIN